MFRTDHVTKTMQEFADLHATKHLNLKPAFQRRSVWSEKDRQLLVLSIMEGMPIPSVYLYRRAGKGGVPIYDVIDGKQRLESLLLYMRKGPLLAERDGDLMVRTSMDGGEPDWWGWVHLTGEQRHRFLTARIPVIEVEGEFNEIVDLFIRINSTGKRLDGQEKRHARYYDSPVLRAAQSLADKHRDFLTRSGVLSLSQIQRMRHVELMTELLLSVNAGSHLNKKAKLDDIIAGRGIEGPDLHMAAGHVTRAIHVLQAMLPNLRTTRFRQIADFYTLTMLLHTLREEGMTVTAHGGARNAVAAALLTDFGHGVDEVNELTKTAKGATALQEPFRQYLMTVKEGTDTSTHRKAREKLLRAVLDGVFDDLDTRRSFNEVQRRILWNRSKTRRCGCCKKTITRWEDVAADHIHPFIRGGKTTLDNAALTHKRCNAAAGAKNS